MSYSTVVWIDDPLFIKRQRVQMACSFCRQRKIRCDGRSPCSNCKKYATDCNYVKIEKSVRGRNSIKPASPPAGEQQSSANFIKTIPHDRKSVHGKRSIEEDSSESQNLPPARRRNTNPSIFSTLTATATTTHNSLDHSNNNNDCTSQSNIAYYFLLDSSYLGKIMLFPEFSFSLSPSLFNSPAVSAFQGNPISKPEPKLPSIEDRTFLIPDKDTVEHLLSLYWINIHPYIPVLNKSTFLRKFEDSHDPPSPLLLNAMFAIASEFSDRPSIRSDPETRENGGWIFFDRARGLIDTFMDAPRMSTIAALILMSIYQQHNTRRSGISAGYFRRWMYIGIAIRMALELDLNRDIDDPNMDRSHKELRKRLWWSLFMVDVLVSCGIGKFSHLEDDECTISEPDEDDLVDEPELKINDAFREFVCQIKFTRLLHQLLKHNFSSRISNAFINHEIITGFEDQIHAWFMILQAPRQATESSLESSNNCSTTMLHLHMLYHSFIILLHRRYILNQSSLSKCVQAAKKVTPIGSLILHNHSSPFRGFLNCSIWCLLQAGMIHALNKVVGNEAHGRVAEEHYEKIVHLFRKHSQMTALQVLQDYANTCSSHRVSVMEAWSSAATTDNQEMFALVNGSKNLSYGGAAAAALHVSPAANSGGFDIAHLSQISTPFPSPHNGTDSPLCGATPHKSPDVDHDHFTNVTSPLVGSEGTSVHSPDEFNFIPFLGKVQGISNDEDWFNNSDNNNSNNQPDSSQHGTWHHNLSNNNFTRFSLASPHPATPPSTTTVGIGHTSSPIKKFSESPVVRSPHHHSSSNSSISILYADDVHTPAIQPSPTTSPFHSPAQQEADAEMNSDTITCDRIPSVGATPPGNYSHPSNSSNVGSNRHESATTGYFVGNSSFSGLGICSN
ncbi:13106_t:CDS:2 [Acaulospora colombiana]|uniref:13106_t:CDS:1 n=1 Tax=Acaulospora colombiana TaxID=27376 RepID=A0ACA9LI35_9GLOM|nr:13106_t:CDS:2 [Acaulospora colombiana]